MPKLRSDVKRDRMLEAMAVLVDEKLKKALSKPPVEFAPGVHISRRQLLHLLLAD